MDRRTMVVLLFAIAIIGGGVYLATSASVENTRARADATVAKAQEHTRRAEGRHDLVDVLGWFRGKHDQNR